MLVLTDCLGDGDLPGDEAAVVEANLSPLTKKTQPHGSERGADTNGDTFQHAHRLGHACHGNQNTYSARPNIPHAVCRNALLLRCDLEGLTISPWEMHRRESSCQ